jgi:hypothetical protein
MRPFQNVWDNNCLLCSYGLQKRSPSEDFLDMPFLNLLSWISKNQRDFSYSTWFKLWYLFG